MRTQGTKLVHSLVLIGSLLAAGNVLAQRPMGAGIEVATLAGVTMLKPTDGSGLTMFGIPTGSSVEALLPSLRLSFWSTGRVAIETAVSFTHLSSGGSGVTLLLLEGGPSFTLTTDKESLTSIGGVLGILESSGPGVSGDLYVGPQAIVRTRVKDHYSTRVQVGARFFLDDSLGLNYSIEILGGLGFFL